MAYQRKTRDYWAIETNWGYGWEEEDREYDLDSARATAKSYRDNACGRLQVRLKLRREPIPV